MNDEEAVMRPEEVPEGQAVVVPAGNEGVPPVADIPVAGKCPTCGRDLCGER